MAYLNTLYDYQREHFASLTKVYEKSRFALDSSATGCGKTIIAITLAKHYDLKIFVICPNGAKEQWRMEAKKFGADDRLVDVINYEAFSGKGMANPKHGYIEIWFDQGKICWKPTKKAVDLVKENVLFVYDEAHYLKNNSRRSDCVGALSRAIMMNVLGNNHMSKIYCATATPFDKEEHATNMMFSLGIIPTRQLIKNTFGDIDSSVFYKFQLFAKRVLPDWEYSNLPWNATSAKVARDVVFMAFKLMMSTASIGSHMIKPEKLIKRDINEMGPDLFEKTEHGVRHTRLNLYGSFEDDEDRDSYFDALEKLEYFMTLQAGKAMGISNLIHVVQRQKAGMLARYIDMELKKNPNRKVIAFTDMVEDCSLKVFELLQHHNPLLVTGRVRSSLRKGETVSPRQMLINKFNEPNTDRRLMIMTTSVGGQSLNLHDTHGNYPRSIFILPSWNAISMNQAMGRHCRAGVKSDCRTFILYGPSDREARIFNVLHSKGGVLGDSSAREKENFTVKETVRDLEKLKIISSGIPGAYVVDM